jgi:hypothetical protein
MPVEEGALAVVSAIVTVAILLGKPSAGLLIALCYCGLLRAREALNLKSRNIIMTPSTVVLCLGRTKRGMEQKLTTSLDSTRATV